MNSDTCKSNVFSMGRWHCYALMLIHQSRWVAIVLTVLIVALIVAGFIVSPWMGIAAISFAAFIAVMVLNFIILVYGFNSVTGVNMGRHSLSLHGDRIMVEFEEGVPMYINCSDILPYSIYPGGVLIPVTGIKAGWLWVPPAAFSTSEDFQKFLKTIYHPETPISISETKTTQINYENHSE